MRSSVYKGVASSGFKELEILPSYPSFDLQGHNYVIRIKAFISARDTSRSRNKFMNSGLSVVTNKQKQPKTKKVRSLGMIC
jgi:hypothetical protein